MKGDLLLEACALLKENHADVFKLLLVGDGDVMQQLRRTVQFFQLENMLSSQDVLHDEVQRYYSLIDMALPRRATRCELVSPLKPFEAMASGKVQLPQAFKHLLKSSMIEIQGSSLRKIMQKI